jgi:hypothetical protein
MNGEIQTTLMDEIEHILTSQEITTARIDVLEHLIGVLCSRIGIQNLDGMSIRDYFQSEKFAQLERIMIGYENQNPTVAAYLSNLIDEAWRTNLEG